MRNPPPPMPELCGSTNPSMVCTATAASMALPPARSISRPASTASGFAAPTPATRGGCEIAIGAQNDAATACSAVFPIRPIDHFPRSREFVAFMKMHKEHRARWYTAVLLLAVSVPAVAQQSAPAANAQLRSALEIMQRDNAWTVEQQISICEIPAPPFKE